MLLFAALTVILTIATVWGSRIWLNSETLVFAVGDANGPEARFAAKLATMLKTTNSRLHLKIVANPDSAKALAQFDRKQADLAVLRTDAKVPPRARAIAILEHDVVLLFSPAGKKIKSLAELKKRKIAVVADADSGVTLIRRLLEISDDPAAASRLQMAPPNSTFDKLLASGGYGAVIAIAPASRMLRDKSFEQQCQARRIDPERRSASRRRWSKDIPGLPRKRCRPACCPPRPRFPRRISIRSGCSGFWSRSRGCRPRSREISRGRSTRTRASLRWRTASPPGSNRPVPTRTPSSSRTRAPPTISTTTPRSFVDRYSDLAYLGVAVLGIIGSLFVALYTKVTRIAPEKASELATAILDIGERMEHATSMEALDALAGRTRNRASGGGDRAARRHHLERTGWIRSSSAMNSCATSSACGARA